MNYLLMALVFIFGAFQPFQAGMNASMHSALGNRFQAGFINGFVNVMLLLLVLLVLGKGLPSLSGLREAPWWAYFAGAIGAVIVITQLSAAPVLGASLLVALFVAGQVSGSVIADGFGLVGYAIRPPSILRIVGLLLVVVGVIMVAKFNSDGSEPIIDEHRVTTKS